MRQETHDGAGARRPATADMPSPLLEHRTRLGPRSPATGERTRARRVHGAMRRRWQQVAGVDDDSSGQRRLARRRGMRDSMIGADRPLLVARRQTHRHRRAALGGHPRRRELAVGEGVTAVPRAGSHRHQSRSMTAAGAIGWRARNVLKLPTYRRLFAAYGLNELAWAVGTLALAVLVYRRTGSALGSTAFFLCSQVAPAFVSPARGGPARPSARPDGSLPVAVRARGRPVRRAGVDDAPLLARAGAGAGRWRTGRRDRGARPGAHGDGRGAAARRPAARGQCLTNFVFSVCFMLGPADRRRSSSPPEGRWLRCWSTAACSGRSR